MSFRLFFWIIDCRGGLCSARRIITDWTTCQDRNRRPQRIFRSSPFEGRKRKIGIRGFLFRLFDVLTSTVIANHEADRLCQYLGSFKIEQFLFNIIFKSN